MSTHPTPPPSLLNLEQARIRLAVRLVQARQMDQARAAQLAGLPPAEFEGILIEFGGANASPSSDRVRRPDA
jgi:hypothetical protein